MADGLPGAQIGSCGLLGATWASSGNRHETARGGAVTIPTRGDLWDNGEG